MQTDNPPFCPYFLLFAAQEASVMKRLVVAIMVFISVAAPTTCRAADAAFQS